MENKKLMVQVVKMKIENNIIYNKHGSNQDDQAVFKLKQPAQHHDRAHPSMVLR